MPSLPVRGFGEDGLLVTGGVGDAGSASVTIVVTGTLAAVVGSAVMASGALVVPAASAGGAGYRPLKKTVRVSGELQAVTGLIALEVDSIAMLEALWMLDDDLIAVGVR